MFLLITLGLFVVCFNFNLPVAFVAWAFFIILVAPGDWHFD